MHPYVPCCCGGSRNRPLVTGNHQEADRAARKLLDEDGVQQGEVQEEEGSQVRGLVPLPPSFIPIV